jgi:hypothetical protein
LRFSFQKRRTAVLVFKHSPGLSLIEPEQAKRPHKVLNRSDLHLVNDTGHMVTYAGLFSSNRSATSVECGQFQNPGRPYRRPNRSPQLHAINGNVSVVVVPVSLLS